MSETMEREFGWDDAIEKDSEFELLPEGDYDFEVTGFERARHNGSDKLPPCNKAVLTIKLIGADGKSTTINCLLSLKVVTFLVLLVSDLVEPFLALVFIWKHSQWKVMVGIELNICFIFSYIDNS